MDESSKNLTKRVAMFSIHSDPLACLGSQQAGGQNIYVRSLVEELDKLGWQIDVFTRLDTLHKKEISKITKKSRLIRLKGGKAGYISKEELINVLPEIYENFLSFIKLQNPYSLFHGHYWDGGWLGLQASKHSAKPLVTNFHSLGIIRMQTKEKYLKTKNDYDYFSKRINIENEIARNSNIIISLAETEKDELVALYGCKPEKCAIIPGGVNLKNWAKFSKEKARESLRIEKEKFVLLYVGRLEWRKGIGTLIEAGNLLKNDIPSLEIIIVGGKIFGKQKNPDDFKEYKRLENKAKELGIENMVKFVGMIQNTELSKFYSAANSLIVPSYYEPFGLVTLEGMASKIPVIASSVGGLTKIISDKQTGLLFEPHNSLDLKEKILTIFKSKEIAEKLIKNAEQDVKKYSWQSIAKEVAGLYQSLINNNHQNENSPNSSV